MNEKLGQFELNNVYCIDAVEGIKKLPSNSIDLMVASPPYDNIRDYKGFSLDLSAVGKELFRVMKDGGIAVMVIQDQTKNFGKSLTSFRTAIDWCDNAGFKLFETLIYRKVGARSEGAWWNKRFRVDHEYMFVFLKGKRPQYFNKEPLKIPSKHAGRIITDSTTRLTNGQLVKNRPFKINPKKCRGTIWEYIGDGTRLKHQHPATFPDKLPYDFIQCFCPPNGIVLDVFIGSGTTALAAIKLGRKFLGFDISKEYVNLAKKRIETEGGLKLPLTF